MAFAALLAFGWMDGPYAYRSRDFRVIDIRALQI
jgi:hypothetical protein